MALDAIYSFLTYPKKNQPDDPLEPGATIPIQNNKLNRMLGGIFERAAQDCNVPVMFVSDGAQQENAVRSELVALVERRSLRMATPLAARLQRATGGQSGMGLLFVCLGDDQGRPRIVISRFPADEGVVAERSRAALSVQFVEQVFLKSAYSYKAATYVASGRPDQLWTGHVVDRQINAGNKAVADYWISDFLLSEFATTAAAGTKRLAVALKQAITNSTNIQVKHEIASAAHLAGNLPNRALTIADFCDRFHFSDETKQLVLSRVKPQLANERFRFDSQEFARHLAYKQVELNNGAVLTAPADRFDQVFHKTLRQDEHTFVTSGTVVDERLRRTK
ncbi:hypothetical protein B7P02_15805 [Bordetella bronchiseptica]|uniref:hypothetical protein n=1 Tax=Bordetella bronchiseptica TaxID=518 RepID=UPI000D7293A3|nr:hypothetical protein [Bordetella bronchiseptica]AWP59386.1 hypothetical protein B7P02_15805 [Bordetella bronchiseptica]